MHRKNAKQACTLAHISSVRVHPGKTYGGVTAEGRHAGFVYPLARPCVISLARYYQRERNFLERDAVSSSAFPHSLVRPVCRSLNPLLPPPPPPSTLGAPLAFPSFSLSLAFPPFDPRHSFISSLLHFSPHLLFCILFARSANQSGEWNIRRVFPARFS